MTIVLYKEHIAHWSARLFPEDCLGFAFCPLGLPLTSYLLPPASCLLDCLGFAFCPLAVSYKPGSTVNRHSDKSLFLLTSHKSENEKRKQRGRMLKLSSAKLVCCVQSWNTRLSCFLELWEIASPIVCISWLLFCLKAFHCVCSSNVKKHKIYNHEVRTTCN